MHSKSSAVEVPLDMVLIFRSPTPAMVIFISILNSFSSAGIVNECVFDQVELINATYLEVFYVFEKNWVFSNLKKKINFDFHQNY